MDHIIDPSLRFAQDHSPLLGFPMDSVVSSQYPSADPSPSTRSASGSAGGGLGGGQAQPQAQAQSQPGSGGGSQSNGKPAPKKRKTKAEDEGSGEGGAGVGTKAEPKKRPQSCDVCRARKVKCIKPSDSTGRCEGCVALDQRCEYTHERKKPGPANSFARKPSPTRQYSSSSQYIAHPSSHVRSYSQGPPLPHHSQPQSHSYDMPPPRWTPPSHPIASSTLPPGSSGGSGSNTDLFNVNAGASGSAGPASAFPMPASATAAGANFAFDASFLPISPQSLLHPMPGEGDTASEDSPMGRWGWMAGFDDLWDPKPDGMVEGRPRGMSLVNEMMDGAGPGSASGTGLGMMQGMDGMSGSMGSVDPSVGSTAAAEIHRPASNPGPGLSGHRSVRFDQGPTAAQIERLMPRVTRIEDVAPFSTVTRILHGYHAHLYALMPAVHWPTFSQQLVAREDERSPSWLAFLLSLVAYSIIQLPRSSLSFLPVRELRRLHQRCHAESRRLQNRRYKEPKLIDVATLYCDHIYLGTIGRTNLANVVLAEAIRVAQMLYLHDERLGEPVYDVVERETRRRVFWLLYGSDRTITGLTSVPMHIQDCDLCLPLPLAIDDALLTTAGAFPQPPGQIPVLAGFHFNVRVYRLLGVVLTAHRQLMATTAHPTTDPFPMMSLPPVPIHVRPSRDFMDELDRILADLPGPLQLSNPTGITPDGSGAGPVSGPGSGQMGAASGGGMPLPGPGEGRESGFATCRANILISQAMVRFAIRQYAKAVGEEDGLMGGREWAEKDVLHLLESMSSESLAANGESLRRKVLFVASSLLEKYPSSAEGHSYVTDFLSVYTRISEEQHAALLEESAAPSREPSPGAGMSAPS